MTASNTDTPVLLQPENQNKKYEALFVEIDSGQIKLPMFQREFVWDKEQTAKLIDSILKGFPIGTFIFWKTREHLRSYKDVGNHKLPDTPNGDSVQYILDGQQRITSLYAIRKGIRITKDGKEIDYRDIFIDLDYSEVDEQIVVTDKDDGKQYISVHSVLTRQITSMFNEYPHDSLEKIESYKNKLTGYDFSTITIKDYPIDIACEVFSRINTGGKSLSVFEVMVAKTYDETRGFDLAEKFEELRDGVDDARPSLAAAKFETIPETIAMQCVAVITLRAVRGKDILRIPRPTFIDNWEPMKAALFMAIDFVRTQLRVPVSQLLPYPAVLIPIMYYFYSTNNRRATYEEARRLEQFYYWVGLNERYSSSTDSRLAEDLHKMDCITRGEAPTYSPNELTIRPSDIAATWFSTSNSYCKAILSLFASHAPQSFDTNGVVILDNSNLKIASSRNYHHFFPRRHLEDVGRLQEPNLIANITMIDGYSNKHLIGKKAPSVYVEKFAEQNSQIDDTLKTHLIINKEDFGVMSDDYETFIKLRSIAIANELNAKIMSPTLDRA